MLESAPTPGLPPIEEELPPIEEETDPERMYWADLPEDLIGEAIEDRIREVYECRAKTGVVQLWRRAHAAFYSLGESGNHEASQVIEFGDSGEMLGVRSNQLRSIIKYVLTSGTADRPAFLPKAVNSSAAALAQVPLARTLLDYYHSKKGLEQAITAVALRSLIYGKGLLWLTWDVNAGPRDPMSGKRKGDVALLALSPFDVVCDPERKAGEHDWYIIKRRRNKYDLAAQYGGADEELRDYLINMEDEGIEADLQLKNGFQIGRSAKHCDDVAEWHFLHAPTAALPRGRYTIIAGKAKILMDGPLPFDDLHVYDMTPEEFLEAGDLGYGTSWEIMGLQQVYDGMLSTAVSNFDSMGTNDIMIPDGVDVGHEEIRSGLNVIRYPQGTDAPTVLEKFQLGDPFFKLYESIRGNMQLALGVNDVVRGDPQASLKSGSALALVQAQAVHFQSGFQGAVVHLQANAATAIIQILKRYANEERLASIAGSYDQDALRAFSSKDINQIDSVEVEVGPAISRTVAGKTEMATQLLERGLITDPSQYYHVLATGRLEPIVDPKRRQALRIQEENEILMKGPPVTPSIDQTTGMPKVDPLTGQPISQVEGVPVMVTQDPVKHIQAHASVLDSAAALGDDAVVLAVTTHIMEHMRIWRDSDPELMGALGYAVYGMSGGMPPPEEKGGDPAKGANDQKSREAAEKRTGPGASGDGRDAKLPQPAKPPPEVEL